MTLGGIIFNPLAEINKNIDIIFKNDINLLKEVYLAYIKHSDRGDHKGLTLSRILEIDCGFMLELAQQCDQLESNHRDNRDFSCVWLNENYETIMNEVLHELIEQHKAHKNQYLYRYRNTFLKAVFQDGKPQNELIIERQDNFLGVFIRHQSSDVFHMKFIFDVISKFPNGRIKRFVELFLSVNKEFHVFEKLSIEHIQMVWWNSELPLLQQRKEYFESLLPLVNSVELLEHRHYLEQIISNLQVKIEKEKKFVFLED